MLETSGVTAQPSNSVSELKLKPGRFALFVSTVDPRKNHLFAVRLWRQVRRAGGREPFPLVFAGRSGRHSEQFRDEVSRDTEMAGTWLHHLEDPDDADLSWLFQHAAFTLFPSDYEGYGLPVAESLAHGKYCLAADNSSLREVSQGLAWHRDTFDGEAWKAEVLHLIRDEKYLADKNAAVASKFRCNTWDSYADQLVDIIASLGRTPNDSSLPKGLQS
jgi:glycosyltransferase involved in cell wall biosynthesis